MGKIDNISEPWKGHSFGEVETFIKEEIGGVNDALDQILPSSANSDGNDDSWQNLKYLGVEGTIKGAFRTIESKIEDAIEEVYGDRAIHLTFEAAEDGVKIFFNCFNENEQTRTVEVSTDGGETWRSFTSENYDEGGNTPIASLNAGQTALVRGDNEAMGYYSEDDDEFYSGGSFRIVGRCYVYGNVMSLLDSERFYEKTAVGGYAFYSLFFDGYNEEWSNPTLLSHPEKRLLLPATTIAERCYESMFRGCTSLVNAPALPATTLAEKCYGFMFYGCTSLVNAPALPATTLAEGCYRSMFDGCASLVTAPSLPATTLKSGCYSYMFRGCSSLKYVKAMFTTTPTSDYTNTWLNGVSATGTFVKNAAATWDVRGVSGIPTGWTVETASE